MYVSQNEAGDRRSHDAVDGKAGEKQRKNTRLFPLPKPIRQIQDNPRIIARFGKSKQDARRVQLMDALDQTGQRRNQSPAQKNSRNPHACPNLVHHQIAGNFEKEISDEEDSGGDSILLAAQAQILVHGQLRKTNIHAVDHRDDVKQEQVGDQPNLKLPNRFVPDGVLDDATRQAARDRVFCVRQETPSMNVANRGRSDVDVLAVVSKDSMPRSGTGQETRAAWLEKESSICRRG